MELALDRRFARFVSGGRYWLAVWTLPLFFVSVADRGLIVALLAGGLCRVGGIGWRRGSGRGRFGWGGPGVGSLGEEVAGYCESGLGLRRSGAGIGCGLAGSVGPGPSRLRVNKPGPYRRSGRRSSRGWWGGWNGRLGGLLQSGRGGLRRHGCGTLDPTTCTTGLVRNEKEHRLKSVPPKSKTPAGCRRYNMGRKQKRLASGEA